MTISKDKIRWGMIGTGVIAKHFAQDIGLVEDGEITVVAGRDFGKAKTFAREHGIDHVVEDANKLVSSDIDAVYIATPHPRHAEQMALALEHGKHVLCEKPFTMNADEASRVIEMARARGLFLMEAMWTRFLPAIVRLREVLNEGVIGDLEALELSMGFGFKNQQPDRLFNLELGGGCLLDMGVYCASFSQMINPAMPRIVSQMLIGSTGVDEKVSWIEEREGFMVTSSSSLRSKLSHTAVLSGTKGQIRIPEFFRAKKIEVKGEEISFPFEQMGLQFQIEEVHRCVRQNIVESPIMPWKDTIAVMESLDQIREVSLREKI